MRKYRWINEGTAPAPLHRSGSQGGGGLPEKITEAEAQNKILWKRLAVVAIQKFLEQPARKDLAIWAL